MSADKQTLEDYESACGVRPNLEKLLAEWELSHQLRSITSRPDQTSTNQVDFEMSLTGLQVGATKGWTLEDWMTRISDDQRRFIQAPVDKSIRLRGPAGSGKTLALTLKAISEVNRARDEGQELRVLFATHSWSLASEIADSITAMGMDFVREIDVFPLLAIAQTISPQYVNDDSGYSLIGNDNLSGKQAQISEIQDILEEFDSSDWVSYRKGVTPGLAARFDSTNEKDRLALAWDLLGEFGSVIGAAGIFPGAGAEARYLQLSRARWMMPLQSRQDMRAVFAVYSKYMEALESRSLLTADQVLADFLNHLTTHVWNRARRTQGYDLLFVDEFHLFSPIERQVLHYLARDISRYPSVFMAVDPRQSPSEAFIGLAADETSSNLSGDADGLGDIDNFDLTSVHRFSPQILSLVKHLHLSFPTLELGRDWEIDFDAVESLADDGPVPQLINAASREGELLDIHKAVQACYGGGRVALAIVDTRHWARYSELSGLFAGSGRYHVSTVSGRSDIDGIGYRRRGLVIGPAEYLAGLQFETVLVAGMPDLARAGSENDKTRMLSLLYLAVSRAEREVRIFVNEEDEAVPEVLMQALESKIVVAARGSLT